MFHIFPKVKESLSGSLKSAKQDLTPIFSMFFAAMLLLASNTVYAASFDCNKASTKVEKMICADPELSKLDDELGKVYSTINHSLENNANLKYNQKGWLKWGRNRCADSACLEKEYRKQIIELKYVLATDFVVPDIVYPPYPEVWQQIFPLYKGERGGIFSFFTMKNGSYLVYYSKFDSNKGDNIEMSRSFFGEDISITPETITSAYYRLDSINNFGNIELANQTKITRVNLDYRMQQWCPQTLTYYYEIEYPDGSKAQKSVLYLLDEPIQTDIKERCPETMETHFNEKVNALMGEFFPLADDGFLFAAGDAGVVIRFDANFQTKSKLLGKRLFVVDTNKLKKIGIDEFETMNYQRMQDTVLEFLGKDK